MNPSTQIRAETRAKKPQIQSKTRITAVQKPLNDQDDRKHWDRIGELVFRRLLDSCDEQADIMGALCNVLPDEHPMKSRCDSALTGLSQAALDATMVIRACSIAKEQGRDL